MTATRPPALVLAGLALLCVGAGDVTDAGVAPPATRTTPGELTIRLELTPSQLAVVREAQRSWPGAGGVVSIEIPLTEAQQQQLQRTTGTRPTWLEVGGPERFDEGCRCDDTNVAVLDGDAVQVFQSHLSARRLSEAERRALVDEGSYVPAAWEPNFGTDACEVPRHDGAPSKAVDFAETPALGLGDDDRRRLRALLDGLDLGPFAALPDRGFRHVRIAAPRIPEDAEDNGFLDWAHDLGGVSGLRVLRTGRPGLEARERSSGPFRLVVFHDAALEGDSALHRVGRALVFRGDALLLWLTGDGDDVGCRHPERPGERRERDVR